MNIKYKHIILWLLKCKKNIENFNNIYRSLSKQEKLKYIRYQYRLIKLINQVLENKTQLTGFNFEDTTLVNDRIALKNKIKTDISKINLE
jgi:hypothetical protein